MYIYGGTALSIAIDDILQLDEVRLQPQIMFYRKEWQGGKVARYDAIIFRVESGNCNGYF